MKMSIFKKKPKKEEFVYIDPDLDIEAEFRKRRKSDIKDGDFDEIEGMQYVNTQCQVVAETSAYIEKIKDEYRQLGRQMSDISSIESLSEDSRLQLKKQAVKAIELREKKKNIRREKSKLTSIQHDTMEKYEEEFPKALVNLQNDEKYLSAVKHDMKMLESEEISLREDIENCTNRRLNIRNVAVISFFAIMAVFVIFLASGQIESEHGMRLFMIVLLMAALLVLLVFIAQRNVLYRMKLAEKKLNRAVMLLNKTKIKYVNIANSVDYQQKKYHTKNAYELGRTYEIYLDEKKKLEKYRKSVTELDDAEFVIDRMLTEMNLFDPDFWMARIDVLADDKAMKTFKKELKLKRVKLMDQIEFNRKKTEDAKNNVMKYVKEHPEQSEKVMAVVDSYDEGEKTVDI